MSASVDGYVTKQPITREGEYGRYVDLDLRVATAGKEVHYVSSRFYGRKIGPIMQYINNGDYITMSGCVTSIKEKTRESGKYCQIYLKDACYTLPPKASTEARFKVALPDRNADESEDLLDDFGFDSDNDGEPF